MFILSSTKVALNLIVALLCLASQIELITKLRSQFKSTMQMCEQNRTLYAANVICLNLFKLHSVGKASQVMCDICYSAKLLRLQFAAVNCCDVCTFHIYHTHNVILLNQLHTTTNNSVLIDFQHSNVFIIWNTNSTNINVYSIKRILLFDNNNNNNKNKQSLMFAIILLYNTMKVL